MMAMPLRRRIAAATPFHAAMPMIFDYHAIA
jgi:hypothetical protein